MLIDVARPSPLWTALFPRQGILDSLSGKGKLNNMKLASLRFSLLLTMDIMCLDASSSGHLDFLEVMDPNLEV